MTPRPGRAKRSSTRPAAVNKGCQTKHRAAPKPLKTKGLAPVGMHAQTLPKRTDGPAGPEPVSVSDCTCSKLQTPAEAGGADSGANEAEMAPDDPELRAVIHAWPALPATTRAAILRAVSVANNRGAS